MPSGLVNALAGVRVLVVDDDVDTLDVYCSLLELYGATVLCVRGAAPALTSLESFAPDVLLSDISMPVQDGLDLIRSVRERGGDFARIPAIAMTAHVQPGKMHEATAAGFNFALPKPVEAPRLISTIRDLLLRRDA